MNFIHRHESGRIAWWATVRYVIALAYPMWDGDAPGRAYTPTEQRMFLRRTNERKVAE